MFPLNVMSARTLWHGSAALSGAALLAISLLAPQFRFGTTTPDHPWELLGILILISGAAWFALASATRTLVRDALPTRDLLLAALGLGLVLRLVGFGDVTIYEDDWLRYLWDGAVLAEGHSPFTHSPATTLADPAHPLHPDAPAAMVVLKGINNPTLSTIYPPVATALFAVAHVIEPYSVEGLRALYLLSDALTLGLMVGALRAWGRDPLWAALYALSPLLLLTGFNSAHMDILLAPFLVGALWLAAPGQPRTVSRSLGIATLIALAAAIKVWPLLLAPILLRPWRGRIATYLFAGAASGALTLLLMAPLLLAALSPDSGLSAYSGGWNNSAFLFPLLESALAPLTAAPGTTARLLVATFVGGLALWLGVFADRERDVAGDALLVTAALLFLSPTGYPWYGLWLLVFLPFRFSPALALLLVLTPVYYVRFALGEAGRYAVYTDILIPLAYGLPLLWLAGEALRSLAPSRPERLLA